jgi:hypothetical protein
MLMSLGNSPENTENLQNNAVLTEDANDAAATDTPLIPTAAAPIRIRRGRRVVLFSAVYV